MNAVLTAVNVAKGVVALGIGVLILVGLLDATVQTLKEREEANALTPVAE